MRLPSLIAILVPLVSCAGPRALERPDPPGMPPAGPPAPPRIETPAPPAATSAGASAERTPAPTDAAEPVADAVFAATVRPVLASRCTPCHERGGRMYDRLPFDDASVVASHADPVLRRLKEPKDKDAVEAWLARRADPR